MSNISMTSIFWCLTVPSPVGFPDSRSHRRGNDNDGACSRLYQPTQGSRRRSARRCCPEVEQWVTRCASSTGFFLRVVLSAFCANLKKSTREAAILNSILPVVKELVTDPNQVYF